MGPVACAELIDMVYKCGLLREACYIFAAAGETGNVHRLPPATFATVFQAALEMNDLERAKAIIAEFRSVIIMMRRGPAKDEMATQLFDQYEQLALRLLDGGLPSTAVQVLEAGLREPLLSGKFLSSELQSRLSNLVLSGTLTPESHGEVYRLVSTRLPLEEKVAILRKCADWPSIVKVRPRGWCAAAVAVSMGGARLFRRSCSHA